MAATPGPSSMDRVGRSRKTASTAASRSRFSARSLRRFTRRWKPARVAVPAQARRRMADRLAADAAARLRRVNRLAAERRPRRRDCGAGACAVAAGAARRPAAALARRRSGSDAGGGGGGGGAVAPTCLPNPDGSGIFRSDDSGKTWNFISNCDERPMYFSQIRVDPVNVNKIFTGGNPGRVSHRRRQDLDRHHRLAHRLPRLLDQPERSAPGVDRPRWRLRQQQRRRRDVGLSQRHRGGPVLSGIGRYAASLLGLRRLAG